MNAPSSLLFPFLATAFLVQAEVVPGADLPLMGEAYRALWNDAEQARIDADIEKNRKADGAFAIDAPDGTAVQVEQLSHAFRFGAHIFNFNQLGSTEANDTYKAAYGADGLFNQATVSFYWIDHEPTPGAFRFGGGYEDSERYWNSLPREETLRERHWRRPAPGPVIDFLRAKGVAVHGHVLIWGQATPYWVTDWFCPESEKRVLDSLGIPRHSAHLGWEPAGQNWGRGFLGKWAAAWRGRYAALAEEGLDEAALAAKIPVFAANLRRLFRKRVFDVAAAFGDAVDSWDVVNESAGDFSRYGRSRTGLPLWFGWFGIMPGDYPLHALLDAREAFPATVKFAVNDANLKPYYVEQVKDLEKEGARIDLMGCQMHIFDTNACARLAAGATNVQWVGSPSIIRERLDAMAMAGRPIHVSEVTIAAPGEDDRSRRIQAVLVRNIYRAWFSHPAVMGITWWNTVDGAGVAGEPLVSGLFTRDMEKKPAWHVLDDLIHREWKTRLVANVASGQIAFRGFRGRYRLSWTDTVGASHIRIVDLE
jgi:GH35 family endo-1,4-beta-xylanase